MSLWEAIYRDYRRYRATGASRLVAIFLTQGFWASCVYRISRLVVTGVRIKFIRRMLLVPCAIMGKFIEIVTGIYIPNVCEIGEGLYIGHFGMTMLGPERGMGRNCSVSHGVTLGLAGHGQERGGPLIGDRVYLGPHAIVIGKITIGDDALICPGTVVFRSVPPRAVVMGNPARVVSYEGSFDYIKYDGMESDPDRIASLSQRGQKQADHGPATRNLGNGSDLGVQSGSNHVELT
jgi:serine O-acetyltransferase